MTILDELANYARERVALAKQEFPERELEHMAFSLPRGKFEFEQALQKPGISFICSFSRIEQIRSTADAPSSFASKIMYSSTVKSFLRHGIFTVPAISFR